MIVSATMTSDSPPTVAVIGCGPGGMFFCHALETKRRALEQAGDEAGLAKLPIVTCFERASAPGGVWRAKRSFESAKTKVISPDRKASKDEEEMLPTVETETSTTKMPPSVEPETTNMYEALWTNGPKESIEFFDYTFDEHFKCPLPVYMPRQDLLDYMIARVTKHCPDFFEKYVKFNTAVNLVKFNESKKKFEVTTFDWTSDKLVTEEFDKCIWAAGENGRPKMPRSLVNVFREGGFQGRVIHSSDTANFEADVKGKRILLVGGSYSAEDLTLMAIKVGVEHVYISSRQEEPVVEETEAWPGNKVTILPCMIPVGVTGSGRDIQLAETWWTFCEKYVKGEIATEISDIDTVIFCTGYDANISMLNEDLRGGLLSPIEKRLEVPSDWKMTANVLTEKLGDVEPGDVRWCNSLLRSPHVYNGVLISNPSMMYIENEWFPNPLFATDVSAWLLLAFITGSAKIPSQEEMMQRNLEEVLRHMQNVALRYGMDSNYCAAWDQEMGEESEESEKIWYDAEGEWERMETRMLARAINMAKYPVSYGTYDKLNEIAEKTLQYSWLSYLHRAELDPDNENENSWRTFRDYKDADKFKSFFTGKSAVPLHRHWLDIDTNDRSSLGYSVPVTRVPSDEGRQPKETTDEDGISESAIVGQAQ